MPNESSAACRRAGRFEQPLTPGNFWQPKIRVPSEGDRYVSFRRRDDRGFDRPAHRHGQSRATSIRCGNGKRRRVDVDRGAEARRSSHGHRLGPRSNRAHRRAGRGSAGRCHRCPAVDPRGRHRHPRRGSGATPTGSPTGRATGARTSHPPATGRRRRGGRGTRVHQTAATRRSCRRRGERSPSARLRSGRSRSRHRIGSPPRSPARPPG